MTDRTPLLFKDVAGNTYNEAQVVLEEKDGKKTFHTGNGGTVVTPVGSGESADAIYDVIKADRDAARGEYKPLPGEQNLGGK